MTSSDDSGGSALVATRRVGDESHVNAIIAVLGGIGVVVAMMQTLMVPLLPTLPSLLHTSSANASWAITATLLTASVANPVYGRLGDLYGKRRMVFVAGTALACGSVVCALSSSLVPLLVGRSMQGLGMAIIPLGISIMRDLLPAKRLIPAMALMSSSLGIGSALGLPIAAAVAQQTDWHVLFWGSAVAVVALMVLIWRVVPESPVRGTGRFDLPGAILLSGGLVALLLAVSKGSTWGWTSTTTLGLGMVAAALLVAWTWWETRAEAPLVDLRTTIRRPVLLTNIASVALGFAMYANSLINPQLLQLPKATGHGLGQSLLATGLWMAPVGLVMMAVSPIAGRLITARGPRTSLIAGSVVIAGGYCLALGLTGSPPGVLLVSCVISTGVALAYASMPTLIMQSVPASEGAAANGLNTLMRSIGTTGASAVIGVVLANMTIPFGSTQVPSLAGLHVGYLIGAGAALIAGLLALGIPGRAASTSAVTLPEPRRTSPQATQPAATSTSSG
ncbi:MULTISPECIES: MFS transporter [unclassified Parafrankia]|uniref:MFS transporter n=1 Tax=Parafrankia TaxID=2994362 RepID=UPI000DA51B91|nr:MULTISPECIES: MFS transporter [unclassified Parafrankia]TCJ31639.1 MFS transporter [Parafrankia sp. BMG5.11]SQD95381.1 Major facilitator superfamily MFS_1 [Parafrankia sp. Ea1.12]